LLFRGRRLSILTPAVCRMAGQEPTASRSKTPAVVCSNSIAPATYSGGTTILSGFVDVGSATSFGLSTGTVTIGSSGAVAGSGAVGFALESGGSDNKANAINGPRNGLNVIRRGRCRWVFNHRDHNPEQPIIR